MIFLTPNWVKVCNTKSGLTSIISSDFLFYRLYCVPEFSQRSLTALLVEDVEIATGAIFDALFSVLLIGNIINTQRIAMTK